MKTSLGQCLKAQSFKENELEKYTGIIQKLYYI